MKSAQSLPQSLSSNSFRVEEFFFFFFFFFRDFDRACEGLDSACEGSGRACEGLWGLLPLTTLA